MHHPEIGVTGGPLDSADIEVAVLDAKGVIVAVNGPWTDFCDANDGNPALTGVGMDYLEVCSKASDEPGAKEVADAITAALAGGRPSVERIQIACHSPHQKRWFDVLVSSRTDETGKAIGATVMVARVPNPHVDQVDADHTIAREVFEACPDALLLADEHDVIESMNRSAERLFGCNRVELLGQAVDTVLSGQGTEAISAGAQLVAIRADGCEIPVEVGISRRDVGGQPRRIAAIRDISERLRSNQQASQIEQCIDRVSDAILILDENSLKFLYANQGAADMFGYCKSELVDNMTPTDLVTELSFCEFVTVLGALRERPDEHVRLSTRGLSKNGSQFPIEIQLDWPAPDSPNAPRPVAAVIRNLDGDDAR
ncbi:MAG: PAS domain-containing protein [Acidimicrobiales bacterium]